MPGVLIYPMTTIMTGFIYAFQKSLHPCALDKSSISIGRVKGTSVANLSNVRSMC